MDAAQTNFKKIVFFLAAALLFTAPFQASAQTLAIGSTAIVIGSSACNQSQTITVASTSTVQFTVAINYGAGNLNGNWLYANFGNNTPDFGSTSSSTPITATTGPNGVQLTIGLNYGLASATPVAGVVLTPAGGSPQTITVYYTQNTSCGGNTGSVSNGFFSVSPGNIAISSSQPSQTVTIQDNIGTGFAFTPTVSPANSWLSVNASSTTVAGNGSTAITVTGNANETSGVGSYNGILTITPNASGVGGAVNVPVVFTVSSGSGSGGGSPTTGTLTVNNTNSNTANISIGYVQPNVPGGQCVNLVDTAANATSYSWSTSTSSGGNWLLANNAFNGATPQNLAASYGACIQISLNPAIASNLPSGAYSGAVVITSISGSSATINVNLYISAGVANGVTVSAQGQSTSGAIYAFPNEAANTSFVQEETFTVTAASGYSLGSPTLASTSGDFTMNTATVNGNTLTFTVTSSSSGLIAGLYTATITVPSSYSNTSANTVITVVQPVGQAGSTATGGSTTTTVQPTSLTFQEQADDSFWTGGQEKQAITITGAQGGQWSATVVYGAGATGWLTFDSASSGTFGNGPATLLVDLFNVSSLSPSTTPYQAEIDITAPSGLYQVAVTLLVTPSNTPVLLGIPASTTFSVTSGASTSSQTVTIVGSDNTSSTTSPPIVAGAPTATWLSATTSGNTLTLSINNTAQSTGVYSATVPITASAYSNAIEYPVVLIVNGGGGHTGSTGPLTLSSTALNYTNVTGSITQDLDITASTSTQFTLTASQTNCTNANWLSVTNGTYIGNASTTMIPVTVNPAGIANGTTCNGVITLVSTGSNGGTQTVSVSMTVASSSGSGNVTVTPTTMTFAFTQGNSNPAAQTATVVNAISGTASISFTVGTTENNGNSVTWLSTNVNSAATPYNTLSISVAPGNLPAGTYTGTVTITPNGGSAETISVTMTVNSNLTVTATPTTVDLTYTVGGTAPTATLQVSGGGAAAPFTATAASTGGWLQVTPTSGTTPNTGTANLTVSTVASALNSLLPSSTPYTGTITVTGTSPATGTTIVNVSLTVSAALPVISSVINAASGATGAVSPGEIISLFAPANGQSPIGPASSVSLSGATCPSPCTAVPTSLGGVTVTFLPGGYLAPLLYVGAGQINAVVPYQVAGIGSLSVEVKFLGQSSNAFPLTLASTAPGIFTYAGSQQAAAYQYSPQGIGSYNASSTPATAGWILVLYVTGEGVVVPPATTGSVTVASGNPPSTPTPAAGAPTVLFNNKTPATLAFYGEAPGFVSGLMQLNVVVPPGAGTGAVPVTVTIGGNSTQAGVTVFLQ
jgi:uncharacterized protein (TIGR03437 family)